MLYAPIPGELRQQPRRSSPHCCPVDHTTSAVRDVQVRRHCVDGECRTRSEENFQREAIGGYCRHYTWLWSPAIGTSKEEAEEIVDVVIPLISIAERALNDLLSFVMLLFAIAASLLNIDPPAPPLHLLCLPLRYRLTETIVLGPHSPPSPSALNYWAILLVHNFQPYPAVSLQATSLRGH